MPYNQIIMKIYCQTSKMANFFFFLANLSEWHWSCRHDYNQVWLTRTGPLNEEEEQALQEFKTLMEKYGFSLNPQKYLLGRAFLLQPETKAWSFLNKKLPTSEFKKIKNIFRIFKKRFNWIWQKDKTDFGRRLKNFQKILKQRAFKNLIDDMIYFLNGQKSLQTITTIFIMSPLKGESVTAAGGANLTSNSLTIELPTLKKKSWEMEFSGCFGS